MASDQSVAKILIHPRAFSVMQDRRSSSPRAPWVRRIHGPALIQALRIYFEIKNSKQCFVRNVSFKHGSNEQVKFCFLFTQKHMKRQFCHIGRASNKFFCDALLELPTHIWFKDETIFPNIMKLT